MLGDYLQPSGLPPPKPSYDYSAKVGPDWGMMKNDSTLDCTCAAAGHAVQEWTKIASGNEVTISDDDILAAYSAVTGYPANDNGAYEIDVLNYWRNTGIGGHKIQAYVALEPKNIDHVKDSIEIFGNCHIGLALPQTAQDQTVWTVPSGGATGPGAPDSWGGHAVIVVGYDPRTLTVVTWGKLKQMTWQFWQSYCDEAYAVLSPDWFTKDSRTPEGLDMTALTADLAEVSKQMNVADARILVLGNSIAC